jgi:hypothetical protein
VKPIQDKAAHENPPVLLTRAGRLTTLSFSVCGSKWSDVERRSIQKTKRRTNPSVEFNSVGLAVHSSISFEAFWDLTDLGNLSSFH